MLAEKMMEYLRPMRSTKKMVMGRPARSPNIRQLSSQATWLSVMLTGVLGPSRMGTTGAVQP